MTGHTPAVNPYRHAERLPIQDLRFGEFYIEDTENRAKY